MSGIVMPHLIQNVASSVYFKTLFKNIDDIFHIG